MTRKVRVKWPDATAITRERNLRAEILLFVRKDGWMV